MMISNVKGQFTKITGVLTLDEGDVTKSTSWKLPLTRLPFIPAKNSATDI